MDFSVVTKDAVKNLKGQIPSPALPFDLFEKSDALNIMKKMADTIIFRQFRKDFLSIMPKRAGVERFDWPGSARMLTL